MNNNTIITPYGNNSITNPTTSTYLNTNKITSNNGMTIYGNSNNIQILSKNNNPNKVNVGETGPIIQLYGAGGKNATVGINFDTFQSKNIKNNGRYNGNNPATQILAIDNGSGSSDLIFKTTNATNTKTNTLNVSEERMSIGSNGNVNIVNNLNVSGKGTFNNINTDTINVSGISTLNNVNVSGISTLNNVNVSGISTLNNINVSGVGTFSYLNVIETTNLYDVNISGICNVNNIDVSETCTLNDINSLGISTLNYLNVIEQTNLHNVNVSNNLVINGTSQFNGEIYESIQIINNNITLTRPLANVYIILVNNDITIYLPDITNINGLKTTFTLITTYLVNVTLTAASGNKISYANNIDKQTFALGDLINISSLSFITCNTVWYGFN